ncbi:HIT family protein [Mycobacterium sp. 050128]|uniref:HIT family protein n=1 Tax=Mycobacterium sp. 050128 TaxID=3096112 RepID=UPI003FA5977D
MPTTAGALGLNIFDRPQRVLRSCRLCNIEAQEPTIHQSADASAVPSLGSFIAGWTLVVPRRHVLALSDLSSDEWSGFTSTVNYVRTRIEGAYGDVISFEHGSAGPNRLAGCGVDHAHLHIVPSTTNLRSAIDAISTTVGRFQWEPAEGKPEARRSLDYLYIADSSGQWITYGDSIPSQVVRRALAAECGRNIWDWKEDHCQDIVADTLSMLLNQ